MKVTPDDIQTLVENPIELFYQSLKSEATKDRYTRFLFSMLCHTLDGILEGTFEERAKQLVILARANPEWATNLMLAISKKLKERTTLNPSDKDYLNPNSVPNYFKPLRKLLDMNSVPLAWKRVFSTFPEENNNFGGRGYTRQEIQKMLSFTKGALDKAIILVAASSGIREGGLVLKWGDITPVYKVEDKIVLDVSDSELEKAEIVCGIVVVYKNTNQEYPAFITPEAYKSLEDYKTVWRKEIGREPKPQDPLFKRAGPFLKTLSADGIKQRVYRVIDSASIRPQLVGGKRRHEVPIMNGFRRFFNKSNKESISKDSPIAALIEKEYMMGHIGLVKLDKNYFKTHITELVEEYLNAVPNLTINDSERQKLTIKKLKNENENQQKEIIRIVNVRMSRSENRIRKMLEKMGNPPQYEWMKTYRP